MATWQAVRVDSGAVEKPKYSESPAGINEIWRVTFPTAPASGDTINGPVLPANTYLMNLTVAGAVDSSTGLTIEAGYAGQLAAFMKSGTAAGNSTTPVAYANVGTAVGYVPSVDTPVVVTLTAAPTTFAGAGSYLTIMLEYTGNP